MKLDDLRTIEELVSFLDGTRAVAFVVLAPDVIGVLFDLQVAVPQIQLSVEFFLHAVSHCRPPAILIIPSSPLCSCI